MAREMKYELSYDKEAHLLLGRVTGEIDPALVEAMAREVGALVVPAATRDFLFLETVALNRGHNTRIFTDPEAARAWLA